LPFRFGISIGFLIVIAVILVVVIDGGEGAEEQAANVGEDGGAAGRDASFGEELVESAEGVVDALESLEIEGLASQGFAEVNCSVLCGVMGAKSGGRIVREVLLSFVGR
jgi:hypothetical protein